MAHLIAVRTVQAHAVGGLGIAADIDLIEAVRAPHDRPFGTHEIPVRHREAQGSIQRLHLRVALVKAGGLLQGREPGLRNKVQASQRPDELHRGCVGEVIHRLVHGVFLELRLFCGESFRGRLVCAVGSEPKLVTQHRFVVIQRTHVDHAFSGTVVAVLFIGPHLNDNAQHADSRPQCTTQSPEGSLGHVLIDVHQPVIEVVRRRHVRQFELSLGALHFRLHRTQHRIVAGRRLSVCSLCGQCAESCGYQCHQSHQLVNRWHHG